MGFYWKLGYVWGIIKLNFYGLLGMIKDLFIMTWGLSRIIFFIFIIIKLKLRNIFSIIKYKFCMFSMDAVLFFQKLDSFLLRMFLVKCKWGLLSRAYFNFHMLVSGKEYRERFYASIKKREEEEALNKKN